VTPDAGLSGRSPEAAWKHVDCGLCGSAERELSFRDGEFSVVRCGSCGLTYVTPRLENAALLAQVYDEGYWSSNAAKIRGYTDYRADAPLYLKTYAKRMRVIRRNFSRPGRVLDVGCAAGYFLEVMRSEGWEVLGLEQSDSIRRSAEARLGPEHVRGGLLSQAELAAGSFDLVTLWDVLEHVPDTLALLAEVRRLLAPEGKLLIETQDVSSRAARLLGRRWQHYKHAEHIYHFEPRTLENALAKAGFEVLENSPRLAGKYVSMGFIAERAGRVSPLLSWLLSPLKLVGGSSIYVNLQDEMIVVARPR
jgi:SAM-dependent methyltransferase